MPATATVQEQAATYGTPPSREVLELAQQAVRDFHECFWWWDEKAELKTRADVRAVVEYASAVMATIARGGRLKGFTNAFNFLPERCAGGDCRQSQ